MLLYLFYNADLITSPKKEEAIIAYVDDASYYAEGTGFEEAYDRLCNMMNREGGGYEWSDQHNSHFETSKMVIVGFSHRWKTDPLRPGKTIPEPWPDFLLRDATINPSSLHKYLGIVFDQELRWKEQAEHATGAVAKWTLCFRRLTKPAFGIRARFMRQLYCAVAILRFMYAVDVWYAPVTRRMQGTKAGPRVNWGNKAANISPAHRGYCDYGCATHHGD